ncbi:MAG: Strictosidine synthase, partial [Variovorax sp.]|nr:Strictosidine synthase [Variovorax sp.]
MFDAIRQFSDRLLGRGDAAITVPVMDGALKPNRALDDAEVVATLPDIDDLATDGATLFAAAGAVLYRLEAGRPVELRRFDAAITALAVHSASLLAVALGGKQVLLLSRSAAGWTETAHLDRLGDAPLHCVNALSFETEECLLLTDGSARRGPDDWCRDLMEKGRSGRVGRWRFGGNRGAGGAEGASDRTELLADRLEHAYGVMRLGDAPVYSESWRHRVVRLPTAAATGAAGAAGGPSRPLLADLPGYPSRMAPAARGGFWLTCFVCRTQLVEFVLREVAYRTRMLDTVDPLY